MVRPSVGVLPLCAVLLLPLALIAQDDSDADSRDARSTPLLQAGYEGPPPRLLSMLLAAFGAVSLLMATLGIYGVINYAVGQRTREFGIRMALGARPADLSRDVVRGGTRLAGLGLVIGIGSAWVLTRFLESELYEIQTNDPRTFAAMATLLAGVALLGSYLPARRAARVDPTASLGEG